MKSSVIFSLLGCAMFATAADVTIPVETYKLSNGLRVILSKDNAVPVITVYMGYDVGARSEEKGRTGFAHLFEHMMFQGSANVSKGGHFSTISSNGGIMNGTTHADFTDYYDILPSNKLATALWLESDRMRSLSLNDDNLKNQKEAVKQERRMRFDNQPYTTAILETWSALMYQNWQSSHSLIGSFEDLNAATVDDVSKFFKANYAPNNATLVIVGDIEIAAAKKSIESYFGDIPSQPVPKHPDLAEPATFEPRTQIHKDPLARVPAVILGFPGPKRRSPDYYALNMIDAILTGGDSSRFHLNLVKGKQSVLGVQAGLGFPSATTLDYRDPEDYGMFVVYKPNFTAEQIVQQVQDEIAKLQTQPIEPKELDRVKTSMRANRIKELQSSLSRAQALAQYQLADGDPRLINTELDKMLAVTPAQIQAAAAKYLTPEKRNVLSIVPAPKPPAPPAAAPAAAPAPKENR